MEWLVLVLMLSWIPVVVFGIVESIRDWRWMKRGTLIRGGRNVRH